MQIAKIAGRLLLLAGILTLAGCSTSGQAAKRSDWPTVPPLPQKLRNKTDYAGQVRQELYEPSSSPSPSETKQ